MKYVGLILILAVGFLLAQGENCNQATVISSLPYWAVSNTTGFQNDYNLPSNGCTGNISEGPDAVYAYSPTGPVCVSLEVLIPQSGWNASIYVLTDCENLVCVSGADNFGPGSPEALYVTMAPGNTYYFVIDGRNADDYGPFVVGFSECSTDIEEGIIDPLKNVINFKVYPTIVTKNVKISMSLPFEDRVSVDIYDASGRLVSHLFDGKTSSLSLNWDGKDSNGKSIKAGVYFVRVSTLHKVLTEKLVVVR